MTNAVRFVFRNKYTGHEYEVVDSNKLGTYWRRLDSNTRKRIDYAGFEAILEHFRNDENYEEV